MFQASRYRGNLQVQCKKAVWEGDGDGRVDRIESTKKPAQIWPVPLLFKSGKDLNVLLFGARGRLEQLPCALWLIRGILTYEDAPTHISTHISAGAYGATGPGQPGSFEIHFSRVRAEGQGDGHALQASELLPRPPGRLADQTKKGPA